MRVDGAVEALLLCVTATHEREDVTGAGSPSPPRPPAAHRASEPTTGSKPAKRWARSCCTCAWTRGSRVVKTRKSFRAQVLLRDSRAEAGVAPSPGRRDTATDLEGASLLTPSGSALARATCCSESEFVRRHEVEHEVTTLACALRMPARIVERRATC